MYKGFVFAVQIAHKMLGPLRKIGKRIQIDNCRTDLLYGRIFMRKQRQITQILR